MDEKIEVSFENPEGTWVYDLWEETNLCGKPHNNEDVICLDCEVIKKGV